MSDETLLQRFERVADERGIRLTTLGKLTLDNVRAYNGLKAGRMWPITQDRLAAKLDEIEAELRAKNCA